MLYIYHFLALLFLMVIPSTESVNKRLCHAVPRKPEKEVITFISNFDDTTAVRFSGYLTYEIGEEISYLPLHLQKVDYSPPKEGFSNSTLRLLLDCATVEIDLIISESFGEYQGESQEIRLYFKDYKMFADQKATINFRREIVAANPVYTCEWTPEVGEKGSWNSNVYLHIGTINFVLQGTNVSSKFKTGQEDHSGYRCDHRSKMNAMCKSFS